MKIEEKVCENFLEEENFHQNENFLENFFQNKYFRPFLPLLHGSLKFLWTILVWIVKLVTGHYYYFGNCLFSEH